MKKSLLTGLFVLLAPLAASAGSHMRSGGETFVSAGVSADMSDKLFDKSGNLVDGNCNPGRALFVYGERGYDYYTTLFASASLRSQACVVGSKQGLDSAKIGLTRRVNPTSNALVWEAALLLPGQRFGNAATRSNPPGIEGGLHYHLRPDLYDLTQTVTWLEPYWDFGATAKENFDNLPAELVTYGQYTRPLKVNVWDRGIGGWTAAVRVDYLRSLWHTQATTPLAVDNRDAFWKVNVGLSLKHALTPRESLRVEFIGSPAGRNVNESRAISLNYEKTLLK